MRLLVLFAFALSAGNAQHSFIVEQVEKQVARMEEAEGYVRADTTVEKDAVYRPSELRKKSADPAVDAVLDKLQKEMVRLAPRWKFPTGPFDARLDGFARKGVANWHPGGQVMKTVMDTEPWHISKNRLGIPLERDRRGWVLYKMPEEPLCRQQSFQYYEKFDGTGYQPSNGVRLNYVRFLACK